MLTNQPTEGDKPFGKKSAVRILFGFNGATIVTLGDVALPVKAGLITQQVLFSIVVDLGPYNAIMGRA